MKDSKLKIVQAPKHNLADIKKTFNAVDKLKMTATAMQGQYKLGFSDQDVYKSTFKKVELYVKFQIDKRGEMIVSFKARSGS